MKRLITIIVLVILGCSDASAQWFLFPGGKNRSKAKKMEKETVLKDTVSQEADSVPALEGLVIAEQVEDGDISEDESSFFRYDMPQTIGITLALPLKSTEGGNPNFMEMYEGALLAARDMGNSGVKITLNTIDTSDKDTPLDKHLIRESDIVIGPVSADDMRQAAALCPGGRRLVSPLDPKAAALVDSCRIVQVPSPWTRQYEEMVSWIKEEKVFSDNLIVICDSTKVSEQRDFLLSLIAKSGVPYTLTHTSPEKLSTSARTLVVIASDREEFINGVIREVGVLQSNTWSARVTLFCTSKARNASLDPRFLYRLNAHILTNYHINYSDPAVNSFILAYRALFNSEPGSFAFQGYDTVTYFVGLCKKYGRQWYLRIQDYPHRGLQSDFDFIGDERTGRINSAVRRVVYNRDLTSTLQ